jgi:deoxycytidylate deaminase
MATVATAVPINLLILGQPSDESSRELVLKTSSNELIFAVVGHVGSGTSYIANALKALLEDVSICNEPFEVHVLKARSVIEEWAQKRGKPLPDASQGRTLQSVRILQDYGDEMRGEKTSSGHEDHSAVARALVRKIRETRARSMGYTDGAAMPVELDRKRRAYIIDSLRHPEEANLLRRLYQDAFVQIGIVCEGSKRKSRLTSKYSDAGSESADAFMKRDANAQEKNGQHVGDTFYLSDFFVDNTADRKNQDGSSNKAWTINEELSRLIKVLVSKELVRPNMSESAMHFAHSAKLRSACLSRQVGAAIIDRSGLLIATGTNEAPKAGGGVYGERFDDEKEAFEGRCALMDDPDDRYCRNTKRQNEIIRELIAEVPELKALPEDRRKQLEIDLRSTSIGQLLEFSRAVHAEMDALLSAAREGVSVMGARMYVTTFPCHYCARHLVAAGIDEVQYIEPYPKSQAIDLHHDSIESEKKPSWIPPSRVTGQEVPAIRKKVLFRPFSGVAPRLYGRVFAKDRDLKDKVTGKMKIGEPEWGDSWIVMSKSYIELEGKLTDEKVPESEQ